MTVQNQAAIDAATVDKPAATETLEEATNNLLGVEDVIEPKAFGVGEQKVLNGTEAEPKEGDSEEGAKEPEPQEDDEYSKLLPKTELPKEEKEANKDVELEGMKLKLPESIDKDHEITKQFVGLAKESGLKQEAAQKLLDMHVKSQNELLATIGKQSEEACAQMDTSWVKENMADKEFGGSNFKANVNYAAMALRKFVPKEDMLSTTDKNGRLGFGQMLEQGRLQNCPPLFRFLARVGKYVAEATPVTSDAKTKSSDKSAADILFGDIPK